MATNITPIPLGIDTCYLLQDRGSILLDAGMRGMGARFERRARRHGFDPSSLDLILLTHAHFDHMGAARELKERTGARLAVHAGELAWVEHGNPPLPPPVTAWGRVVNSALRVAAPLLAVPSARVDVVLEHDEVPLEPFGIPGRAVATPGHSPGSVSVVLDSGEAFVGDLAMSGPPVRLRPGLPIFANDLAEVRRSWDRLFAFPITTIYPAHGPPFSADVMRAVLAA